MPKLPCSIISILHLILLSQNPPHLHQLLPQEIQPPIVPRRLRIRSLEPDPPNRIKWTRLHNLPIPRREQHRLQAPIDIGQVLRRRRAPLEAFLGDGVGELEDVAPTHDGFAVL